MSRLFIVLVLGLSINVINPVFAEEGASRTVKNVQTQGSCAIVGMSAEQSQLIALQRARVAAIEQAAGVQVVSDTVVTNGRLAVDFIKTYSRGFMVKEKVEWLPIGQYQRDSSTPPVPEYRVKIVADVYIPAKRIRTIGLKAELNQVTFKNGDNAQITISAQRKTRVAVFNITADDKVVMLFPNPYEHDNIVSEEKPLIFPLKDSKTELEINTLPGHKRDAEAFFVVARDENSGSSFTDIFKPFESLGLSDFFRQYSIIADQCEDKILVYEVVGEGN